MQIIALLAAFALIVMMFVRYTEEQRAQAAYESLAESVHTSAAEPTPTDTPEPTETPTPTPTPEPTPTVSLSDLEAAPFTLRDGEAPVISAELKLPTVENPIDFDALEEINPELYAWITIDDTVIDYPVAQRAGDREFYLYHNMYGEAQFAGCIYSEDYNTTDFSDPLTVLYGHNMKNGSMFQNLHKFESRTFFDEHETFYVYTKGHRYNYRIFAAYSFDDRHLLASFDSHDPELFKQYLYDVENTYSVTGFFREGITLDENSKVLTLCTCVGTGETRRYLVQAVLESIYDTK